MTYDLRWVLVLVANLLLILLVAEANHYLAFFSLHIFLGGVLLAFGMLRLQLRQGIIVNGITALVLDALNPLPFGQTIFLILLCHVVVFSLRGHFARETVRSGLLIAGSVNLLLMLAFGILAFEEIPRPDIYLGKIATDALLSTAVLLLATPWFLSLQITALAFIGIDLDAEQREAQ